jgi:Flp pilus assembly protein TadD
VAATLVSRAPDNLTYLNLHGIALAALRRNDEARVRFKQALAINAGYQPAALNLAKLTVARRTLRRPASGCLHPRNWHPRMPGSWPRWRASSAPMATPRRP